MALKKVIGSVRGDGIGYWKIQRVDYDTIAKVTNVTLMGWKDKAQRDAYEALPLGIKTVLLDGVFETLKSIYIELRSGTQIIEAGGVQIGDIVTPPVTAGKYEFYQSEDV